MRPDRPVKDGDIVEEEDLLGRPGSKAEFACVYDHQHLARRTGLRGRAGVL